MDDKKLIELAAKAAGIERNLWDYEWVRSLGHMVTRNMMWNPLLNDNEALRLATRLCMSLSTGPCRAAANTISGALRGAFFEEDTCQQDQDYAVRRVIVRAAAEVGEHMP